MWKKLNSPTDIPYWEYWLLYLIAFGSFIRDIVGYFS